MRVLHLMIGVCIGLMLILNPLSVSFASGTVQTVNQAKSEGLLGEKPDGYLGLVKQNAPSVVKAAMDEINIKRKIAYAKLAKQKNVSVDVIATLTGEKLIKTLPSGAYYYDDQSKQWLKK